MFYNRLLMEGYVPDLLQSSIVNPLPEVSPPQEIKSDPRPIALTCTIAKVMEGLERRRQITQIVENIEPCQQAREGNSTADALIYRHGSLRSKRFQLVSEQRKTGFGCARNETMAKK